jgi:hypothetical protein
MFAGSPSNQGSEPIVPRAVEATRNDIAARINERIRSLCDAPGFVLRTGYLIQPPRGATQCVRVPIWSALRSKCPSRDRRARYRSISRCPATGRTVRALGRCAGQPPHSSGPVPRRKRARPTGSGEKRISTRRIDSAAAYPDVDLDLRIVVALAPKQQCPVICHGGADYSPDWIARSSWKRREPLLLRSEITNRTRPCLEVSA